MKPNSTLCCFLLAAGSSLLAISSARAGQTWDGTGADANWNTAANWDSDTLPNFGAAITFAGTTQATNINDRTAGSTIGGINFTNSTAGQAFSISGNSITLGGNIVTTASSGAGITDTVSLAMILNGDRTINTGALHNLTISGISESGGARKLTKESAGTLTISGSTSFTGLLDVRGGNLVLQGANTMGAINVWFSGTSLTFGNGGLGSSTALLSLGASSGSATLIYNGSDDYSIGRQIQNGASGSGQGIIRNNGSGALIFTNSAFNSSTGATSSRVLSIGGNNTISVNQIQGVVSNQHATHTLGITKLEDASIWRFSGLNSYTGATTVNGGTLLIGRDAPVSAAGALGNASSEVTLGVASGNTAASLLTDGAFTVGRSVRLPTNNTTDAGTRVLTIGGNSAHHSEFSGNIILGTNSNAGRGVTLTAASGGQVTFSGVIQNPTSMDATAYTVTKSGLGAVVLSNTNTYSGATAINAGTLAVTGSGSINNTSAINVAAGGTFRYNSSTALTVAPTLAGAGTSNRAVLGGTGPINVAVTLDNTGDVLAPGNSPGIQNYTVGQTWASFSYDWEVNDFTGTTAGTDFDQIGITGTLGLGGGSGSYILNVLGLTAGDVAGLTPNFSEIDRSWTILTTNGLTGFSAANWTINTTGFTSPDTGTWALAQSGNNLVLSYTVVPEPSAALLGGLGMLMLRRRR